jgi:hypothetical protein
VAPPQSVASDTSSGGFDWSTAGISAAILAGLLLASIAGLSVVRDRKRHAS